MRIHVRLFAMQREQVGRSDVVLELPSGADVAAAWRALVLAHPQLAAAGPSVRFARNRRYVDHDERLDDDDELAVIPPVAGGSAEGEAPSGPPAHDGAPDHPERRRHLAITAEAVTEVVLARLREAVATPADGAVAVFLGLARETPGTPAPGQEAEAARFAGQRVTGLTYEAFEPMAMDVLGRVADEMEVRFGVRRVAILHRIGEVGIGEVSVAIAVAAPHRAEVFDACRYAIEELKARAPIWKSERFADGSVWLGEPARSGASDASRGRHDGPDVGAPAEPG
jgi:molybdopterin synthase catalytic subunit